VEPDVERDGRRGVNAASLYREGRHQPEGTDIDRRCRSGTRMVPV